MRISHRPNSRDQRRLYSPCPPNRAPPLPPQQEGEQQRGPKQPLLGAHHAHPTHHPRPAPHMPLHQMIHGPTRTNIPIVPSPDSGGSLPFLSLLSISLPRMSSSVLQPLGTEGREREGEEEESIQRHQPGVKRTRTRPYTPPSPFFTSPSGYGVMVVSSHEIGQGEMRVKSVRTDGSPLCRCRILDCYLITSSRFTNTSYCSNTCTQLCYRRTCAGFRLRLSAVSRSTECIITLA